MIDYSVEPASRIDECPGCHYKTELRPYRPPPHREADRVAFAESEGDFNEAWDWMCDLCASTATGRCIQYPRNQMSTRDILETICFVGNAIMDLITRKEDPR